MRTSTVTVMAILGLATWQIAPVNLVEAASASATIQWLADGAEATGVDNARLAGAAIRAASRYSIGPPKVPTQLVWTMVGYPPDLRRLRLYG